ncbi:MAG: hypothetical protein V1735_04815 [Nanoarchaeota archaeon]
MKELSLVEVKAIDVEIEKSRLNREKSMLVLNKSMFLYFSFLFIAVIGFINNYIGRGILNVLIFMGLCVLVIGTIPYIHTMYREERKLTAIIDDLRKRGAHDEKQ